MPGTRQIAVRVPKGLLAETKAWGARLDRSISWIVLKGLRLALADLRANYPEQTALACPPAPAEEPR